MQFLLGFGYFSVVALIELEFEARAARGSVYTSDECAFSYATLFGALGAELALLCACRALLDHLGRRLTLGALFLVAAVTALVMALPQYVDRFAVSQRWLEWCALACRATLAAAAGAAAVFVPELYPTEIRGMATAAAYTSTCIGGFCSAYWVRSPNPLSTITLLITLVNISAAWASLAMPVETAGKPMEALLSPPSDEKQPLLDPASSAASHQAFEF